MFTCWLSCFFFILHLLFLAMRHAAWALFCYTHNGQNTSNSILFRIKAKYSNQMKFYYASRGNAKGWFFCVDSIHWIVWSRPYWWVRSLYHSSFRTKLSFILKSETADSWYSYILCWCWCRFSQMPGVEWRNFLKITRKFWSSMVRRLASAWLSKLR